MTAFKEVDIPPTAGGRIASPETQAFMAAAKNGRAVQIVVENDRHFRRMMARFAQAAKRADMRVRYRRINDTTAVFWGEKKDGAK